MKIDLYERIWMWAATLIMAMFMTIIGVSTFAQGQHPPSHVEAIEPSKIFTDPRFSKIGQPITLPDGTIEVQMAAVMFAFVPNEIHVPAHRPIRFRLTSADRHPRVHDRGNQRERDAGAWLYQSVHDCIHPPR